ncbi:MAG: hypothetical protein H0V82_00080 [Candidatus Protochlamydia sp.]|nr:hypothetical protein [Candidatus Protochlamydia sp.]
MKNFIFITCVALTFASECDAQFCEQPNSEMGTFQNQNKILREKGSHRTCAKKVSPSDLETSKAI